MKTVMAGKGAGISVGILVRIRRRSCSRASTRLPIGLDTPFRLEIAVLRERDASTLDGGRVLESQPPPEWLMGSLPPR